MTKAPTGKTVEEMARELTDAGYCFRGRCTSQFHKQFGECFHCNMDATNAQIITTKYAEMMKQKGERG